MRTEYETNISSTVLYSSLEARSFGLSASALSAEPPSKMLALSADSVVGIALKSSTRARRSLIVTTLEDGAKVGLLGGV